ncbi:LLM class flavin-dependent oxidoreductase [Croceicoccus marinus]|jgi:luciferase family oxidoreductase group 1|uniref:Luciferase-like monooxygenase n=1 Tax=Croceicoccus marinus TaxID=450378 RepID=A0A1Z1FDQ5_9SPHN|nr:LLM class flavin-dependent oxidoreductase [Croceicoccus marinus]ARU16882.1 alkane 1-monooxygenase [Croceicoccus marinus]QNE05712.1 LLM class flavin-dependent oxidoreductase [Croceicoccus marinus]
MTKLSVLDFVSIVEGGTASDALAASARLAAHAEAEGYHRFWLAEHHAMPGIASSAVSVCLAHIGHATSTIRIGSGGIMLPNHNPFVIAEQFGTLEALFPGRIDLGLGRAPGADGRIARMLRKDLHGAAENFPQDIVELQAIFAGDERLPLQATPGAGADIEMWILGSSLFGAQLAARLGLPYAFAAHFAPSQLDDALRVYREFFQPSEQCEKPHVMVGTNAYAAETSEEAYLLASSMDQSFVALRTGTPGKLPPPVPGYRDSLPPQAAATLNAMRSVSAIGTRAEVGEKLAALVRRTGADELVLAGNTYDPAAREKSLSLTMEAMKTALPA